MRRATRHLAPGIIQSRQTLAEFVGEEWWPRYAIPNLAPDTRRRYLEVWGSHLLPRLGGYQLREITPTVLEDLRDKMTHAKVGAPTQRKALMLLQRILRRAVVPGLMPVNPAQLVDKPTQRPTQPPQPLPPVTVERIRAIMLRPRTSIVPAAGAGKRSRRSYETVVGTSEERQRNALSSRCSRTPGCARSKTAAAPGGDLGERTLHVFATKTNRSRGVDLIAPLAQDLVEWRAACDHPQDGEMVIPRPSRGQWTREDWASWRRRVWRPAAIEAGVTGDLRPYRLRGSFVSLLLWEGHSLTYVAERAGHSIATLARHYAGTMRELQMQPRVPAAEAIRQARAELRGTH